MIKKVIDELKYFLIHIVLDDPGIMLCEIEKCKPPVILK